MTTTYTAAREAATAETAPAPVFRSELNPVDFLYRAAYIYPDRVAVVDGGRRSYRQLAERSWRLAGGRIIRAHVLGSIKYVPQR